MSHRHQAICLTESCQLYHVRGAHMSEERGLVNGFRIMMCSIVFREPNTPRKPGKERSQLPSQKPCRILSALQAGHAQVKLLMNVLGKTLSMHAATQLLRTKAIRSVAVMKHEIKILEESCELLPAHTFCLHLRVVQVNISVVDIFVIRLRGK